ncbi:MAG: permease [Halanaerobium sp.]|nr:permease [Halanaerobium sp.]
MQNKKITYVMLTIALLLAIIAYYQGGFTLVFQGISETYSVLLRTLILLIAAFVVAGMAQVLIPDEMIIRLFGQGSGLKGYMVASITGALIPGGPYVYYPFAVSMIGSGASLGPIISFLAAKSLWSISRLPLEFALLGPLLATIRILSSLVFPPLAGLLAQAIFGRQIEKYRLRVKSSEQRGSH